jgi:hypothetical protein
VAAVAAVAAVGEGLGAGMGVGLGVGVGGVGGVLLAGRAAPISSAADGAITREVGTRPLRGCLPG